MSGARRMMGKLRRWCAARAATRVRARAARPAEQKPPAATKRGDTVIEVLLASAVFGFIAVLTVTLMNSGLRTAQANLQLTMARNEVNAQAEALRYIHNAYVSSPGSGASGETTWNQYKELWEEVVSRAVSSYTKAADGLSCSEVYAEEVDTNSFVLNTAALQLNNSNTVFRYTASNTGAFATSDSFPYLQFSDDNEVEGAYGIWINVVSGGETNSNNDPQYYEFYISTCWDSVGTTAPTRLDTVLRLYNPTHWLEEYN